jgi:starch synthase
MEKKNILFISQEITPYLPESPMANIGRQLPQAIQEEGNEVRVFMPRFGNVNERRNKLHEVIRLSGMNLIINDLDHSLIIKVASIQAARMQVYFIDNEEYFKRKHTVKDKNGNFYEDNDERMIFFSRGVLETVKKLRWTPDLIHCQGWFSALAPLFIKTAYKDDPLFENAKVVYSIYNDSFDNTFDESFKEKIKIDNITDKELSGFDKPNYEDLTKLALKYSDGVIFAQENIDESIVKIAKDSKLPLLEYEETEEYAKNYSNFFDRVLTK